MSKFDIRPQIESQKGFRMSKWDIRPEIKCHNRISIVKMRYSARIRMPKQDFECQNSIDGTNVNVKIRLQMSKCEKKSNVKIGFRIKTFDIRPKFEYHNRVLNVKMRYSARIRMGKFD